MTEPSNSQSMVVRLGPIAPKSPLVVFLHGFMGTPGDWFGIADEITGHCEAVGIALPGHAGLAHSGEDFVATADAIAHEIALLAGGRRAILVGYSMGGRFALYLSLHHPHLFAGAFIESASPGIPDEHAREARQLHDDTHAERLAAMTGGAEFEEFLREWYAAPPFDDLAETQRTALVLHRAKNDPAQLAKAMHAYSVGRQPDLWEVLGQLSIPILFVCGENDHKYRRIAEDMVARSPRIAMQTILNCGHNVHLEQPDAYTKVLRGFLDGVL